MSKFNESKFNTSKSDKKTQNILFQLSGSVACYKSCFAISKLVQAGYTVQTVASKGALQFIGSATLEGLTGRPTFSDLYETGRQMDHIHLARWADILVLAPASANAINGLAHGLAGDAIGTLFLANNFKRPYLIAPAMNVEMFKHPATQQALTQLRTWGCIVLDAPSGPLACGEFGGGRLVEPEALVQQIQKILGASKKNKGGKK